MENEMENEMNNQMTEPQFYAVVNDEEQYSIWQSDRPLPQGWRQAGPVGTRADCLAYIEQVWTDLRPASLRRAMAEDSK
jgi:MbtH protein